MDYLDTIKVFAKVVENGSFSKAAEALHTSPSYVSKAVADLEVRLGCKLLQRTTRQVQLTDAGHFFYQESCHFGERIGALEQQLKDMTNQPEGLIRISAPTSSAELFEDGSLIDDFLAKYSNTAIDVQMENRHVDIIAEGYDLAVRVAGKLPDSSLIAQKIYTFKLIVCASPAYLETMNSPLEKVQDLSGCNCLLSNTNARKQVWSLKTPEGKIRVPITGNLVTNNLDLLKQLTVRGRGVALLPDYKVRDELAQGRLVQLFVGSFGSEPSLYALYPNRQWIPRKTLLFIEHLKDYVGQSIVSREAN